MSDSSNLNDPLEFMRKLWGTMKIPGMSMPSMSPEEVDKQIADLKAVESWLQMNMNMLRGTIQALEVQSATLSALKTMGQHFTPSGAAGADTGTPPFESPFASSASRAADRPEGDGGSATSVLPEAAAMAAQFANPALWWNTVQEQFAQAVSSAVSPEPRRRKSAGAGSKSGAKKTAAKSKPASGTARTRSTKTTKR